MLGFRRLRQEIIDKINDEVGELEQEERKVGTAVWSPADSGIKPIVVVLPEELESAYQETMDSRRRTYVFRIFLMEELAGRTQSDVEKELSDGIDYLTEMFDRKDPISGLSSEGLLYIRPTPGVWGNVESTNGEARVATLTLSCVVIVDN
jgi:hypothetical protein